MTEPRINLPELREEHARLMAAVDRRDPDAAGLAAYELARHALALIDVAEAAHKITTIEDLYRDLPILLRAGALDAFRPKHRAVMDELRDALARFDHTTP